MSQLPFHLPTTGEDQIFMSAQGWQAIRVPRRAKFIHGLILGGGGGGGASAIKSAGAAMGGGGGGGSGGQSRFILPAKLLPEELYVQPGSKGIGGKTSSANGTVGGASYVSTRPVTTANMAICFANGGGQGNGGTSGAAGAAGAAGVVATVANCLYSGLGVVDLLAGQAGIIGGAPAGAVGGNVTHGTAGLLTSGGAAGAGSTSANFNGGNVTSAGILQTLLGGSGGTNEAKSGLWIPRPFTSMGGAGGHASNGGTGGIGGNGAYGGGGGGGGGGTTAFGTGGDGGPGLIILTFV